MAKRLGRVIYWTGCGIAGLIGSVKGFDMMASNGAPNWYVGLSGLFAGGIVYLIGRAGLYILAGE